MGDHCFESGVKVSESPRIFRNERLFCSRSDATSTRQTAGHHKLSPQPNRSQLRIPPRRPRLPRRFPRVSPAELPPTELCEETARDFLRKAGDSF
jgi:hypothetical protein